MTMKKEELRAFVRGVYAIQKLRIQTGQRIVSNAKVIAGIPPGTKEADNQEADKLMKYFRREHGRMAEALSIDTASRYRKMVQEGGDELAAIAEKGERDLFHGVIASPIHFALMELYRELVEVEDRQFRVIEKILPHFPIWSEFLAHVRGVGPAMGGVIISEIDISKCRYPSSLWKYAGVDVAPDGKGRTWHKEHLIPREYIDKNGKPQTRNSITYNKLLKTKLVGVLGISFLRMKDNKYERIYRAHKIRLENHSEFKDISKNWRHRKAIRYMVKEFLKDLYVWWRTAEGLPVAEPYSEVKLRIVHSKQSDAAD